MKQTIKRMTVLLLVFSLVFGMIPAVSAADTQPKTATLVTDVSNLSAGDQIIIVAAAGEYALSTTQNKNNRGQAAVTMSDDGKRVSYSADTQVITLEAGTAANTFAFVVGVEKYLNAASSSGNYLKTGAALSDNGSWTITIDENGITNVVAGGTYTRNTLRYNASSGLFACYAADNTQKDISIYKLDEAGVAPGDCDHSWSQGICIVCGDVCGHDYVDNTCSICGMEKAEPTEPETEPDTTEPVTEPVETEPVTEPTEPPVPEMTLNKVTKLEQLAQATKVVLVAQVDGAYKALGTTIASKISPVTVNVADGTVTADGAAIWNIEATEAGYALIAGGTYLAYNSSTNFKADTAAYEWGFTAGENGGFLVESTAATRGVYYQISGDRFGAYAASNATNADYVSELLVFADVEAVVEDPTEPTEPETEPTEPTVPVVVDYYLFGYINGANYGSEEDYANLGEYKFVDGKVTATFNETSYVAVKTGDNAEWYMTDGWQGEVTSVTLYNTKVLGTDANKLMVPGGVEVTFTLTDNGDDTFTLSYETATVETEPTEPETEPTEPPVPEMTLNKVTKLEQLAQATKVVLVAQVDGAYKALGTAIAGKIDPVTVNVTDGTVTADGAAIWNIEATEAGYALSSGGAYLAYNSSTNFKADTAAYEWGFTAGENGGFLVESTATTRGVYYQISGDRFGAYAASNATNADYVSELLVFADVEPIIEEPTEPTVPETEPTEPVTVDYYLFGYINGANYGSEEDYANLGEYKFVDGKVTATFNETSYVAVKTGDNAEWYMTDGWQGEITSVTLYNTKVLGTDANKLMVPGGVEVTFTLTENGDDTFTLSYETATIETEPTEPETEPTEPETEPTEPPVPEMTLNKVTKLEQLAEATKVVLVAQVDGAYKALGTAIAGKITPVTVNVADGTVTADGAAIWNIEATEAGYALHTGGTYLAYNSSTNFKADTAAYEWGFTAGENGGFLVESTAATRGVYYQISGDRFGAYAASNATNKDYVSELLVFADVEAAVEDPTEPTVPETEPTEPVVLPTITLKYPTLSFESEVFYNVYFSASNTGDVEEMGLLTWYNRPANTAAATYESAEAVIPGATYNAAGDVYMVRSKGVPAKQLGDNIYIRVYAKLSDGTYAYSPVTYYNAVMYANDILAKSQSAEMKSLVVAMLNYGAAAQVHFNHNTDKLMNAGLTAEQKALVKAYSADMVAPMVSVDPSKVGIFKNNGFTNGYPTVSFEGAFSINFYLLPKQTVEGDMILYCWDLNTYNSVDVLTEENATAKITMINGGTQFAGAYEGIAAKQIDETVFVAGVYTSGGVRYSSPVISYSLGAYCKDQIANGSDTMKAFAAETAVYGFYAKAYFASLEG